MTTMTEPVSQETLDLEDVAEWWRLTCEKKEAGFTPEELRHLGRDKPGPALTDDKHRRLHKLRQAMGLKPGQAQRDTQEYLESQTRAEDLAYSVFYVLPFRIQPADIAQGKKEIARLEKDEQGLAEELADITARHAAAKEELREARKSLRGRVNKHNTFDQEINDLANQLKLLIGRPSCDFKKIIGAPERTARVEMPIEALDPESPSASLAFRPSSDRPADELPARADGAGYQRGAGSI